jgi:flagellar protein FlaF
MGFSVSGAAAIIFASMLVAFGMWFTATANSFDQVSESRELRTDGVLESSNTAVEIVSATYNESGNGRLVVDVNNTGAAGLSLNATDLLIDGSFVESWQPDATVDGNGGTDLWLAGEQLTVTRDPATAPDRVKIVTPSGVADTGAVEVFN